MSEIQIADTVYRCNKLPTRQQWHVVRRLMPVMQGLMPVFAMSQSLQDGGDGTLVPGLADGVNVYDALAALSNTIGMLSDADADYILDAALNCVLWRQQRNWMPLRAPGGAFICGAADEFDVQLRLLWEVLSESLRNFSLATLFPSQLPNGQDQTAAPIPPGFPAASS